jgi:hypothetical protein
MTPVKAPFPWFGGKSRAAPLIWDALGDVRNYCEPFFGSGAVLFGRPHTPGIETVNDKDAFLANAWRAMHAEADTTAQWCDWPVNEADLHARHLWLVNRREEFTLRLMGDPDYYDARVAGWWIWGICCWIGSGWCSGQGPWQSVDGQLVKDAPVGGGVWRQLPHLRNKGVGVHRKLVHLGGPRSPGRGIHGKQAHNGALYAWFAALQDRLRYVRVCCGDWQRVLGPSVTFQHGLTGILLDPPYSAEEDRREGLYAVDDLQIAHAVRQWCLDHGSNPRLRIVLCGYGAVHDALLTQGWTRRAWHAQGGLGNLGQGRGRANRAREVLWLSPHCQEVGACQPLLQI